MIRRRSKIRKRHLGLLLAVAAIAAAYVYRDRINDLLGCWAYYDQCTATRINGLSSAACLARSDSVAYLTTEGVCLVRPD
jgi:hypothetical protein